MPKPIENISSDLINLLKDRYTISDSIDEKGKFTDDSSKIKVFSFDFTDSIGKKRGTVVMSLLDDNESSNSLKIYFGQELANQNPQVQKEWFDFLQEMRTFAKVHLLGFDVRNINKSKITRRDVEHDLVLTTEDIEPMYESSFGPIDGTIKTSKQPLGNIKIVIKHTDRIDPSIKYGRSRRIQKIYLVNEKGEKFLLPFKSLLAARAMARHLEAGGTPYDNVGKNICQLVDEMLELGKFYRTHKHDENAEDILNSTRERYYDIKKTLSRMTSKNGYIKNAPMTMNNNDFDYNDDDLITENIVLKEDDYLALPYIIRAYNKAYHNNYKLNEEDEFEKWVDAMHGQGEGDEILIDDEENNSKKAQIRKGKEAAHQDMQEIKAEQEFEDDHDTPDLNAYASMSGSTESVEYDGNLLAEASKIAMKVACPDCGAKKGDPCKTKRIINSADKRMSTVHSGRIIAAKKIMEADIPVSAGFASPLTFPQTILGSKFHTKKEIKKHENTTGRISPFTLLNSKEKNVDDEDREIARLSDLAHGHRPLAVQHGSTDPNTASINPIEL